MSATDQHHPEMIATPSSHGRADFSFTSGERELAAWDLSCSIDTPIAHDQRISELFVRRIDEAFDHARTNGCDNPIVVGAIPFDPAQASCLYVPARYQWRALPPPDDHRKDQPTSFAEMTGQASFPDETSFKRAVQHARGNLNRSELQKVVLSVQREMTFASEVDVELVERNLRAQNRQGYFFRVPHTDGSTLIGVSPELVIRRQGINFATNPLAGSAKRHADPGIDRHNADRLVDSAKDQFEHHLVVKDIASRLGELCRRLNVPGSPSLVSTAALWHLSTHIEGELADPTTSSLQLACRLHPTPAVCGFPTEPARQLIRSIEPRERGLFAGIVGWCDARGDGEWAMTIRCGSILEKRMRLFAGAGIVEASDPDSEWIEVQAKLGTMLGACGLN